MELNGGVLIEYDLIRMITWLGRHVEWDERSRKGECAGSGTMGGAVLGFFVWRPAYFMTSLKVNVRIIPVYLFVLVSACACARRLGSSYGTMDW